MEGGVFAVEVFFPMSLISGGGAGNSGFVCCDVLSGSCSHSWRNKFPVGRGPSMGEVRSSVLILGTLNSSNSDSFFKSSFDRATIIE